MTEWEGALLGEVTVVSLEGTIHYALVRPEWMGGHLLCRHVLLGRHVLEGCRHQAVAWPATLGVLSLQEVVDQRIFMTC